MKKITKRDSAAMNALKTMGYPTKRIAEMFNVTPYTVKYNTDFKFKRDKQNYQRAYKQTH